MTERRVLAQHATAEDTRNAQLVVDDRDRHGDEHDAKRDHEVADQPCRRARNAATTFRASRALRRRSRRNARRTIAGCAARSSAQPVFRASARASTSSSAAALGGDGRSTSVAGRSYLATSVVRSTKAPVSRSSGETPASASPHGLSSSAAATSGQTSPSVGAGVRSARRRGGASASDARGALILARQSSTPDGSAWATAADAPTAANAATSKAATHRCGITR